MFVNHSDVEVTPSMELWGLAGPSSSHVSRGGNIVIELEPLVCPGVGSLAGWFGALGTIVTGMVIGIAG